MGKERKGRRDRETYFDEVRGCNRVEKGTGGMGRGGNR